MKGEAGERVLGRYRLEHPIGEGGFGQVFLGRQVALDREVAIKASRPNRRDDEGTRERFRREALLVAGINHPNVVTYHDFGVDEDGDLVLVMEHLKGCSLLDVLRRGRPVPLLDVARWMAEAAAGLNEAHARGLVHRDVKPSNLFLVAPGTRSERLKVIDFGILLADPRAHPELQGLTRSDAFIGTPEYVAPEMMLGRGLDGRADEYALALVAFELITGRRPFPAADEGGLLMRLSERPAGLDFRDTGRRVPPGVSAALWRALSPSPGERYPTITAFGDALRDAVSGFDEDGHGDRTQAEREVATAETRMLATRAQERPATREDPVFAPRAGRARVRLAWGIAVIVAAGLGGGAALAWMGAGGPGARDEGTVTEVREPEPTEGRSGPEVFAEVESLRPADLSGVGSPDDRPVRAIVPAHASMTTAAPVPLPAGSPPSSSGADRRRTGVQAAQADHASRPAVSATVAPSLRPVEAPAAASSGPGASGSLVLNALPWADVFVDGRSVGRTPIMGLTVDAGEHRIEFRHPLLGTRAVQRDVAAGVREVVKVRMEEAAGGVSPSASP